jgi:penicillin-binding protein 1A
VPFRVPAGIKLISVDAKTGMRASGGGTIIEAFKPGTAPPDNFALAGGDPLGEQAIGTGTGGLY